MPALGEKQAMQTRQYGDVKRVNELSSGLKQKGGVTVERGAQGRPQGAQNRNPAINPANLAIEDEAFQVPQTEQALMIEYARSSRNARVAAALAAMPTAGPWAALYAEAAHYRMMDSATKLFHGTPFFEA